MTRNEMMTVMAVIKEFYPSFHKDKTPQQIQVSINLWHEMFQEDDSSRVLAAVKAFIATDTKGFPPSVGQIKQRLVQFNAPDMPDEAEAWRQVLKAVRRSGYRAKEEFSKLHPIVQRVVGHPEVLKGWGMLPEDEVQTVISSNFQRAYRARAAMEAERLALPSDLRKILDQSTKVISPLPDPEESKRNAIALLMQEREKVQREILGDEYDIDRLRELVNADCEGRCVMLPCKVGDTVYEPNKRGFVSTYKIISIHVSECSTLIGWELIDGIYSNINGFEVSALGEIVFLTREEAEKALEEMEIQ